jgi:hypothetical protein
MIDIEKVGVRYLLVTEIAKSGMCPSAVLEITVPRGV